jgi:hypothetical protein
MEWIAAPATARPVSRWATTPCSDSAVPVAQPDASARLVAAARARAIDGCGDLWIPRDSPRSDEGQARLEFVVRTSEIGSVAARHS